MCLIGWMQSHVVHVSSGAAWVEQVLLKLEPKWYTMRVPSVTLVQPRPGPLLKAHYAALGVVEVMGVCGVWHHMGVGNRCRAGSVQDIGCAVVFAAAAQPGWGRQREV